MFGLNEKDVLRMSAIKNEPQWIRDYRVKALKTYLRKPLPTWGVDLRELNFDNLTYYIEPDALNKSDSWENVPEEIKNTYDKLGIIEAEQLRLISGVSAQYDSEVYYHSIQETLEAQGVIFCDIETGLTKYQHLAEKWFGKIIPMGDNKFSALNSAYFSGGSFVYVPPNVEVAIPLQAYFRINSEKFGQFERTLIIADEGAKVHYVEGCTAPLYDSQSLHAAVVEIACGKNSSVRYTTIQNWSKNVYNLVTKRAWVEQGGSMSWVDANIGSARTAKYPACWLIGDYAHGEVLSLAMAGRDQHQDTGAKMVHKGKHTTSLIQSKSLSFETGRTSYRGLVQVDEGAVGAKTSTECDAMLLDEISRSDTYPYMDINTDEVEIAHEARVSKLSEEQLFYLTSRGISLEEATAMVVRGFLEPVAKTLPMEYAVELNRLIDMEMSGSVG